MRTEMVMQGGHKNHKPAVESIMRIEVIQADTIDAAAQRILNELRYGSSRENVIYFDGWDGLGASTVLRDVAQRLALASSETPAGLKFDQIIHIDCSKWESRRSVQRGIAEQIKLPASVMDMLDRQDEEDDINGLAQGSRVEIQQVATEIYRHTQNQRFVVIFHHGSKEDIDLTKLGLPLFGYAGNKMLWTFRGRFRLNLWVQAEKAVEEGTGAVTDVFLTASHLELDPHKLWSFLAHQEASEVARMVTDTSSIICRPAQVEECFLYMLKICGTTGGQHFINYDLATHSSNYWICDNIIQQQHGDDDGDDEAWRAADALQNEMQLGVDCNNQYLSAHLLRGIQSIPYWASPGYGFLLIPANGDNFQQFNTLGVLKLSHCTFRFSSPPYLGCRSLRFLWLDHCQDQVMSTNIVGERVNRHIRRCIQRLWVLDVRYTCCDWILSASMMDAMTHLRELNVEGAQDWDIGQLQGRLPNIRKLRVTKSTLGCTSCLENNLSLGMNKMELLDFSGNCTMQGGGVAANLSAISTSSNELETAIIIDGCVGIRKFSFRGCAKLKNLLLSGLFEDLHVLDLSDTSLKTLDLRAMTAQSLDELILDNCNKLCAILWPPEDKRNMGLSKVHINTTQSASTSRSGGENLKDGSTAANTGPSSLSWPMVLVHGARPPYEFNWYISIKDARFLRSFVPSFGKYFEEHRVHLEISSPRCCPTVNLGGSEHEGIKNQAGEEQQVLSNRRQQQPKYNNSSNHNASVCYADVGTIIVKKHLLQGGEGNGDDARTITRTRPCTPPGRRLDSSDCYLYAQDQQMKIKAAMDDGGAIATIPSIICDAAYILHVHDSMYNTCIPGSARWPYLQWCRVERCPRLDFIFTTPQLGGGSSAHMCWFLRTFWASQLPKTRFMWDTSKLPLSKIGGRSFEELTLLHLDFCPRLRHVLPFTSSVIDRRYLETLEIVWCGDLRVVFPLLDTNNTGSHQEQQQKPPGAIITTVQFPRVKHIHLHELPKLQSICGHGGRMYAPELETIKIRGCWGLRHLPAVRSNRSNDKVECDCEKEWWDRLEWDGLNGRHHPSLYKPIHSQYYKKKLLRGSVLK